MNNINKINKINKTPRIGGTYAWLVILLSACFLFYKYVLQVSPSVMVHQFMVVFHVSGAGLGNLAATYFYTYLVTQIAVGPLLDRFGVRWLTALAIAIAGLGAVLFSTANQLWAAECARALIGVGAAFATVSYMKTAAMWFRAEQFAFVSGLLATATMIGALFGQAPLSIFINHVGWRTSLLEIGIAGFVIALLFLMIVRDRRNSRDSSPVEKPTLRGVLGVLANKRNWMITFYSGLAFAPMAVFGGLWGNPFLETAYGFDRTQAATLTSFGFLGLAIGGPLFGYISDRLRRRFSVMAFGTVLSLLGLLVVLYVPGQPVWMLAVFLFLFGLGTGSFMLGFVVGKEMNVLILAATVIGMVNTGDAIFGAVSEPLVGKLLDVFSHGRIVDGVHVFFLGDYHRALALLPVYLVAALVFLYGLSRMTRSSQVNEHRIQ